MFTLEIDPLSSPLFSHENERVGGGRVLARTGRGEQMPAQASLPNSASPKCPNPNKPRSGLLQKTRYSKQMFTLEIDSLSSPLFSRENERVGGGRVLARTGRGEQMPAQASLPNSASLTC